MMTPPEKTKSGEGWWWAWRGWLVLSLMWLAVWGWLAREPAAWSQGWVGWWTGDRSGAGAVRSVKPYVDAGAEIVEAEGDAVFRTTGGQVVLGHWSERRIPWTWAGWVRVTTASGRWPTTFLRVRDAGTPGNAFELGFKDGHPRAVLQTSSAGVAGDNRVNTAVQASAVAPIGRWMHLAFSTDGERLRLVLDGRTVAEQSLLGTHGEVLHLAALGLSSLAAVETVLQPRADPLSAEHDDVVLYSRAVPPEELAALVARGRGAWARELDRPQLARRVWEWGWPLAVVSLGLLLALQVRPQWRRWLGEAAAALAQSAGRPVRWVLLCGGLISAVLTVALLRHARHADEARFAEMTERLHGETDMYWQQIAALLMRARDWVAVQTNLSQPQWETWLTANHFPHDYPGVLGVGYAEQVLPGDLAAHKARWSARHGFAYRVRPAPESERERVKELAGNPLLPVVLYGAAELDRGKWFTNGSILGRDLLHRRKDDPRAWCEGRRVETAVARNEISGSALEVIAPADWYGGVIEGLRLYAPWTLRTKADDATVLEPESWRGVLFASVDMRVPLQERYGSGAMIGCRIIEGGLGGELHETVADTGLLVPENAERADALLRSREKINHYHHRLYVDVWTTRAFEATSFRRWAWIAGACSGGLTLLSATLLLVQARARSRQERVLEALRAANSELLLTYREREAMSRDLHDGSIQNLYALGLHLQRVQQLFITTPERARDSLKDSLEMLNQSIAELRQFILSAGVDHLEQRNVATALESLVERLRKTTAAEIQLHLDPQSAALEPRVGVQVLNVVREAVSNALRHAGARRIVISLGAANADAGRAIWRLEVSDDGTGFDPSTTNGSGRGLKNLAARAAELGGQSRVESAPGGGTRVTVEFPP